MPRKRITPLLSDEKPLADLAGPQAPAEEVEDLRLALREQAPRIFRVRKASLLGGYSEPDGTSCNAIARIYQ